MFRISGGCRACQPTEVEMGKPGEPYRPSNGTEGDGFMEGHCYQCLHERWVHRQKEDRDEDKCELMTRSMCFGVEDPQYPREWTYDAAGKPTCTKWVKFDWGSDDDPREPGPKPPPDDPNQFIMPFDIWELFPCADVVVTPTAIIEREVLEQLERKRQYA